MNDLKFEVATAAQLPTIQSLAHKIWHLHYPSIITVEQINYMLAEMYNVTALEKQLAEGHQFTIVYDAEQPIGFISISKKTATDFFIHKFYIDTTQHRRGVGTALFDFILKENATAKTFRLTVNRQNFKAINFYFKHGFVIEKVADFNIGNGYVMNDFVMCKTLPFQI